MADIRTTFGRRSREQGTVVGVKVNTFGLDRLQASFTGDRLAPILVEALQPSFNEAYAEWPVLTGASRDSIDIVVAEVLERAARVALQAGGPTLIANPLNTSHKDYAPFIEFLGTPTAAPGILVRAIYSNQDAIKQRIRDGVKALIASR
jgi:hypothetical protein